MPSITQLEYVVAVAREGHFGRAAESCHVSQPTLSMQIAKLEDEMGVTIFDRSRNPIQVTPTGQAVVDQARDLVLRMRAFENLAPKRQQREAGGLRMGVIPTVAPYLVPLFIGEFSKNYPRIELEIRELTTAEGLRALDEDHIDALVLATPDRYAPFEKIPLYVEPFWVLVNKGDPLAQEEMVTAAQLRKRPMWLLEEGHCLRGQALEVCHGPSGPAVLASVRFQSESMDTLARLIQRVGGITLVPELMALEENRYKQMKAIVLGPTAPAREVSLLHRGMLHLEGRLEALCGVIRRAVQPALTEGSRSRTRIVPVRLESSE